MNIGNESPPAVNTQMDKPSWAKNVLEQDRIELAMQVMAFLYEHAPRVRAILIRPHEKIPLERDWATRNNYPVNSSVVLNHIINGGNHGWIHTSGMSCGIDGDTAEIREAALSLGDTMEWSTGTPGHYCEVFLIKDRPVGNIPLTDGAYIRGKGGQNVAPGSIHPNGNIYGSTLLHMVPPVEVTKAELLEAFRPFIVGTEKMDKKPQPATHKPLSPDSLQLKDLVDLSGLRQHGSLFQGPHPVHGSTTGSNFVVDIGKNLWHCFRHGTGGGPLQWIAVSTGIISCVESVLGKIKGDLFWAVVAAAHDYYGLSFEKAAEILKVAQDE